MLSLPPVGSHQLANDEQGLDEAPGQSSESSEPSLAKVLQLSFNHMTRDQKAKEFEVMSLISALLLGVSGGGLFIGIDLEDSFWRTFSTMSFCIGLFAFMSAATSSCAFMILVQTSQTPPHMLGKRVGRLWHAPKIYFLIGYLTMTAGITGVFLILLDGGKTLACLALCAGPMTLPPVYVLYNVFSILREDSFSHDIGSAALPAETSKQPLRQMTMQ